MPYHVKIRKKNPSGPGAVFGTFGPFTTQAKAKEQAQILADQCAPGHVVTVEPVRTSNPRRRNTTSLPPSIGAYAGRRSNGAKRVHKGHSIVGETGHYVVEAYDKAFRTLKAAKAWIDSHVAAELKRNPRVRRRPNTAKPQLGTVFRTLQRAFRMSPSNPSIEQVRDKLHEILAPHGLSAAEVEDYAERYLALYGTPQQKQQYRRNRRPNTGLPRVSPSMTTVEAVRWVNALKSASKGAKGSLDWNAVMRDMSTVDAVLRKSKSKAAQEASRYLYWAYSD